LVDIVKGITVRYPDIEHHGVTGCCDQLHMDADNSLLADCGLFQGKPTTAIDCSHIMTSLLALPLLVADFL